MPDDAVLRLRRSFQPSPGLLIHDWGESAAVVFVPGRGDTHLIDGDIASLLSDWACELSRLDRELVLALDAQLPALVQAGILQPLPA